MGHFMIIFRNASLTFKVAGDGGLIHTSPFLELFGPLIYMKFTA